MRTILELILSELQAGRPVASAVIVSSSGSTPRSTGSRMAVSRDGTAQGTVGGGPVEAIAQKEAMSVHSLRRATVLDIDLSGEQAAEAGMICGGRQEILIEHLPPTQSTIELVSSLLHHWQTGRRSVLYTTFVQHGEAATILSRTLDPGSLPSELPASLRQEVTDLASSARLPFSRSDGRHTVLVEPIRSPGTVFIAGSGHVGQATAALCATVGFRTVVLDDREDFLSRDRLPQADELRQVQGFEGCFEDLEVTPEGCIVILTRGHIHDRAVLAQALRTTAGYIGMIGSRKKRDAIYKALLEEGFSQSDLDRVHCPIGLSIGAETPEEIAVSIAAELIQERARASL